jgi:hypothetical protein
MKERVQVIIDVSIFQHSSHACYLSYNGGILILTFVGLHMKMFH